MSLFEDRTAENIKAEMLADIAEKIVELPDDEKVEATEGSFINMAVSKYAARTEEIYADLDALNDNMLVDTQDEDHLIDSGAECGVPINEGTTAVVIATLNCPCEIGDEFSAIDSDYNYIATELVEVITNADESKTYKYYMESDEEGIDPGRYRGEIEPEDYLDEFEEGQIIDVHIQGTEQEDIEEYRERRLASMDLKSCAGNRSYYKTEIGKLTGVGGVKVKRRQIGQSRIPVYIQSSTYGAPTSSFLEELAEILDPTSTEGEGDGLVPCGHKVDLNAVTAVTINVTATFTIDEEYTFAGLQTLLEEAVGAYITEQAKTWQDSSSIVVRVSAVEQKLLSVTGVLDVADVQLNGGNENITTTTYQVPVMGTVTEASDG